MKCRLFSILAVVCLFLGGVYFWKIKNTGLYKYGDRGGGVDLSGDDASLVTVGKESITREDLEWEYKFYSDTLEKEKSFSNLGETSSMELYLNPLREKLITNLIERKLLFTFIRYHTDFDLENGERYETCSRDWAQVIASNPSFEKNSDDQKRLKTRLCEWSIVRQFMDEKVFSEIQISEDEIKEYFEKNKTDFVHDKRVVIRQIVLPSEVEARRVRSKVNSRNFALYAKSYSITPEAKDGGVLGPFTKGEMPRFFDVAFDMRVGEIRGVLKSTYGFHVIKLEKKLPKKEPVYSKTRSHIEKLITRNKREREYQKCLKMALNTVSIDSSSQF